MATSLPSQKGWTTGFRASSDVQATEELFRELDAKIEAGMARYHIPGVAIGVLYQGEEYVRGYGVTNVDEPEPVDGDTLFRIASTTKTFTGTTVMRLVEQGQLDLNAPVRRYLPDFRVADEASLRAGDAAPVPQPQRRLGWGRRTGLRSRRRCPGQVRHQHARAAAAHATGQRSSPTTTRRSTSLAASSKWSPASRTRRRCGPCCSIRSSSVARGSSPMSWRATRSPAATAWSTTAPSSPPSSGISRVTGIPTAGLISSAREQLRYARFHMGDGRAADGTPLLTPASLQAMRANPGPGGTLVAEIDGFGVSFGLRRTAEGVRVVMHGGSWAGQYSGFFFVPERDFAMTMLTNSDGGTQLRLELFYDDWALQRFAGLHNPPAEPTRLPATRLAEYEGTYLNLSIDRAGNWLETMLTVQADDGALRGELAAGGGVSDIGLTFYRDEYVLVEQGDSDSAGQLPRELRARRRRPRGLVELRRPALRA